MKFSIIIPSYNVERYIAPCLKSVKEQSFVDYEVIIIDDASTDKTCEVIRATIADDPRFVLCQQPHNAGQSAARNVGLARAVGDYVLFLDSDDWYAENTLQSIAKALDDQALDQLYFAAQTHYENRRLKRTRFEDQGTRAFIEGVFSGAELYVAFEKSDSFRPSSCLYAIRRSIIEDAKLRFREGILHEDLLFLMQLMPYPKRVSFINDALYQRRMRPDSSMTSAFSMRNVAGLFVVGTLLEEWIVAHSSQYCAEFCEMYVRRVHHTYTTAARYLFEISKEEVEAYRKHLALDKRVLFDLRIGELYHVMKSIYDDIETSRTYRLGRLFLAVPSWLKSHVSVPHEKGITKDRSDEG